MRSTAARPSSIASFARWKSMVAKSGRIGVTSTSAGSPARRLRATRISTMSSEVMKTSKMDGTFGSSCASGVFFIHSGRMRSSQPGTSRGAISCSLPRR